jgi:hypothetical protein
VAGSSLSPRVEFAPANFAASLERIVFGAILVLLCVTREALRHEKCSLSVGHACGGLPWSAAMRHGLGQRPAKSDLCIIF